MAEVKKKPTVNNTSLVDMWANIWQGDTLFRQVFIMGKADDNYYIVQFLNVLTGEPNVARVMHISQMLDWQFLPTKEIAEEVMADYRKHKTNRFSTALVPLTPEPD
ncbi:hypothetical protein [Spirosoma utsteinense]|uniref:hypothetical protein n=1 Tax=Spirosoma utsteinense TaxID=2585773 RepID=UPI0016469123|nr:hypothetical protein [Spirosoma utsteinense]MBC3788659.1 geranylgeranyl pyrophosphate synthase [Spirosoma utsteinense]